jgi:nicotinamide-nucleotide amidase
MIARNLQQAEVPDVCTVIQNKRGTAPGMWFEKEGRIFVSMPGVPHEMKGMMSDYVLDALKQKFSMPHIMHRTLLTAGVGESFLADHINEWEIKLPAFIKLAYLPNYGMVRLRLSAMGNDAVSLESIVDGEFKKLQELVKDWLVTTEDEPMEAVIAKILKQRGETLSTAESCTGGYIAHLITSVPGSSKYFYGSVVSYDNSVKEKLLGVPASLIEEHGAVSEEVVSSMVTGILQQTQTNYAIAVSGIMGPDGGTDLKPVGTVWIAVGDESETVAKRYHFRFDRRRNTELTATNALNQLRQFILARQ